ncbi:hypothetical protein NKH18_05020 [Streptomyces sp. M10(2022)]
MAHNGGTVVVLGENEITGWLPGLRGLLPAETNFWWWRTGDDNGVRLNHSDHPAWDFLTERAVRWHYHGLLEPPEGRPHWSTPSWSRRVSPIVVRSSYTRTWSPPPAA